jgi:hypothetical protein
VGELFATGPPPSDACEPPPVDTYDQRLPPTSTPHERYAAMPATDGLDRHGIPLPASLRTASEHRPIENPQAARSRVRTA